MIAIIVLLSVILPLLFFVGNVGCFPQDESIYYLILKQLFSEKQFLFVIPEQCFPQPGQGFANPICLIFSRVIYHLINSLIYRIVPHTLASAALFSYLCFILENVVVFFVLKRIFSKRVAFLSSLVMIFFPARIIGATRLLPDLPINCLMTISYLMFLWSLKEKSRTGLCLLFSGIFFGVSFIIKEPALVMLPPLFLSAVLIFRFRSIFFISGLCVFPIIEMFIFKHTTNDYFAHLQLIRSAHMEKAFAEYEQLLQITDFYGIFQILTPHGYPTWYHFNYFVLRSEESTANYYVGIHMILFLVSLCVFATRYFIFQKRSPRELFILVSLVWTYLYLEFGFTDLFFSKTAPYLRYFVVFKEPDSFKFVLYFAFLSSVVSSLFLDFLIERKQRLVFAFLLIAMVGMSLYSTNHARKNLRVGISELEQAAEYLENFPSLSPSMEIYGDLVAVNYLNYFSNEKLAPYLKEFPAETPRNPAQHVFIIEGGARTCELELEDLGKQALEFRKLTQWTYFRVIHFDDHGSMVAAPLTIYKAGIIR